VTDRTGPVLRGGRVLASRAVVALRAVPSREVSTRTGTVVAERTRDAVGRLYLTRHVQERAGRARLRVGGRSRTIVADRADVTGDAVGRGVGDGVQHAIVTWSDKDVRSVIGLYLAVINVNIFIYRPRLNR